jgi:hypothetical protein
MQLSTNNTEQGKRTPRKRTTGTAEKRKKEFHEAVERAYRQYGNDLSAFLRNIQKERKLSKKD